MVFSKQFKNKNIKTNKKIDLKKFKKDFEILSVLRNLKIIGIFMRLAVRDNKKKYLLIFHYRSKFFEQKIERQKIKIIRRDPDFSSDEQQYVVICRGYEFASIS